VEKRAVTWLAVLAAGGCSVDASLKFRCRDDSDCTTGRICVNGACRDRGDASAPSDDAATDGLGTQRPNFIFVTSQRFFLRFEPPEVADTVCNDAARAAGLPGRFRAWLSVSGAHARDKLGQARGWVRPDGLPFADTIDDIVSGRILYPPMIDELGRPRPGNPVFAGGDWVATGTSPAGRSTPVLNCNEWHNDTPADTTAGIADSATGGWTETGLPSCGVPMRLYCFGVDQSFPVEPPPAAGRRAFLSEATFTPGPGGLAAADALCAGEAAEAGLSGEFLALLPTAAAPAADRFTVVGATWRRVDGVRLNAEGLDLFSGAPLLAPLNVTSKGRYVGYEPDLFDASVLNGARTPRAAATLESTCNDWAEPSGYTSSGYVPWAAAWWDWTIDPSISGLSCQLGGKVYCFER
jgi:hypothetical protein